MRPSVTREEGAGLTQHRTGDPSYISHCTGRSEVPISHERSIDWQEDSSGGFIIGRRTGLAFAIRI
uniref:Uncharacterized protein n=1 Tax=Anguilla anguilla TaxID=7936 RepID=A0A0E9QE77_ANGAN